MATPVDSMIDSAVRCGKCGTPGVLKCDCYEQCSCGWIAEKGKPCRNPETRYCSTKVYHSPAHVDLHKGDRVRLDPYIPWYPMDARPISGHYFGTVAATPRGGRATVSIRWDGRTSCDRIRISWLEKV